MLAKQEICMYFGKHRTRHSNKMVIVQWREIALHLPFLSKSETAASVLP